MSNEPEKPKRIVSKLTYASHIGTKGTLLSVGTVAHIFAVVGIGGWVIGELASLGVSFVLLNANNPQGWIWLLVFVYGFPIVSVFAFVRLWAQGLKKIASRMDPVQPLTRQAAVQLSADETLLRASSAPILLQSTLLRAATAHKEIPKDELLHAMMSKERF